MGKFTVIPSAHAPVVAKVNIITMAVNTLARRESPRAPALFMKIFFLFHTTDAIKSR